MSALNETKIYLTIPADAAYIDIVRLTLYGVASKAGFSYEEMEDMKVAVSEACTNAVLHAYNDCHNGIIDISFTLEDNSMHISIKDYGSSFKYEQNVVSTAAHHDKPLEEIAAGGLGIFMMQALMDSVKVCSDLGTEIILIKRMGGNEDSI
ncbi:anti-sigma B factor RsbW [Paenibacillus yanchengensis]|uniref:Anti-sigma B factor RsbW n=1 Tax=Paenibacillus yanchengensis TaxID=2035833 RepID=A0ABW4YIU5_9BACL